MNIVGLLVTFTLIRFSSAKLCLLSSVNPFSWIVSIRLEDTIKCTGNLINENYVIAPMTCFQVNPSRGFYEGKRLTVVAGQEDNCQQQRRGKLVMGHPNLAQDKYRYNMAWLEVEPFYFDPNTPPLMVLPTNERDNVRMLKALGKGNATCQAAWIITEMGMDNGENALKIVNVSVITRSRCWHTYCPSGNRGCVAYFWGSETYACANYKETNTTNNNDNKCNWESTGAPFVCDGTVVGILKSCYSDRPLMIQGFNQDQLAGIEMYRQIVKGEHEVEPDGPLQEEPPFKSINDYIDDSHPELGIRA